LFVGDDATFLDIYRPTTCIKMVMASNDEAAWKDVFERKRFIKPLPVVVINLSLPPTERWQNAVIEGQDQGVEVSKLIIEAREHVDILLQLIAPISIVDVTSVTKSFVGIVLRSFLFVFFGIICRLFALYFADIVALSHLLKISVGELYLANILYEMFGGCTSFICSDGEDPHCRPMMARSLDWPFTELAKHTVHFVWVRDDKVLFESTTWFGFVGVLTGAKRGGFGISLNARYPVTEPYRLVSWAVGIMLSPSHSEYEEDKKLFEQYVTGFVAKIQSMLHGTCWTSGSIIRFAMESCQSYDEVLDFLCDKRLAAPCYFIVVGTEVDEGVVITRDLEPLRRAARAACLRRMSDEPRGAFVIQTNHDVSKEGVEDGDTEGEGTVPPEDFNSAERHDIACRILCRVGAGNGRLTARDAADLLTTSINKGVGVRMQMSLYFCIIRPYEGIHPVLIGARSSRKVGK
jgi:hypothetical protein